MIVIFLLILLSIGIAAGFLVGFIWSVRSGQYEDTCTPSLRLLMDEPCRSAVAPARTTETGGPAVSPLRTVVAPATPGARNARSNRGDDCPNETRPCGLARNQHEN